MSKMGEKSLEKVEAVINSDNSAVSVPVETPPVDIPTVVPVNETPVPKKRGRKPGSKNKKTLQESSEKQNFNNEGGEAVSSEDHNTLENYYLIAVKAKENLLKKLEKEDDPVAISFIKNSIMCTEMNCSRLKARGFLGRRSDLVASALTKR
jgi:hypothetical protein